MSGVQKFKLERRGNGHRQKHPMPTWSHQRELESLIGKEIYLYFHDDSNLFTSGMVIAADQFTIQLANSRKSVMTYFKHAIRSYEEKKTVVK